MVAFTDLPEKQKNDLAALPYRVGLWISESDKTGGIDADQQEKRALHSIITGFTQDFLKSEFVEKLMLHTMAMNEKWGEWEDDLDAVPDECRAAIDDLALKLEEKDITSLKITLMEIARNVAMAFREREDFDTPLGRVKLYFLITWDNVLSVITHQQPKTMVELMNISQHESRALQKLSEVLKPDLEEGLPNTYQSEYEDEFNEYESDEDDQKEDSKEDPVEVEKEVEKGA